MKKKKGKISGTRKKKTGKGNRKREKNSAGKKTSRPSQKRSIIIPVATETKSGSGIHVPEKKSKESPKIAREKPAVYFSDNELKHFQEIIISKLEVARLEFHEYQSSLKKEHDSGTDDTAYSLHMADVGTDAMEKETTNLFLSREAKFIQYLERALQRIEHGKYGLCKVCGQLIEKGRLEAVPHTEICIACKLQQSK